jgi:AraC-like DNA-binding protein
MQPLPLADRLDPQQFHRALSDLRNLGGIAQVHIAQHSGIPTEPRSWSAMTHVPFLMLPLDGVFDAQMIESAGRACAHNIPPRVAIWYPASRWVDIHHHRCQRYLRITFDIDHTLFGLKDIRKSTPRSERSELCTLVAARSRSTLSQGLIDRLGLLPDGPARDDHARALLTALLHEVEPLLDAPSNPTEDTWLALRDCCARHWREGVGRESLALAIGISPTHVSRLFQRHAQCTLNEHLHAIRLRHAVDLLRDSDLDLSAIAKHCAFANASHLVRVFSAKFGVTPGRWRRNKHT